MGAWGSEVIEHLRLALFACIISFSPTINFLYLFCYRICFSNRLCNKAPFLNEVENKRSDVVVKGLKQGEFDAAIVKYVFQEFDGV